MEGVQAAIDRFNAETGANLRSARELFMDWAVTVYLDDEGSPRFDIKAFDFGDSKVEAFLSVNNLFDERAPLFPSDSGLPGLFYATLPFYDDMGRFYTAGARVKF